MLSFLFPIFIVQVCYGEQYNTNYSVITWKTHIVNPARNHKIPLLIHFPNSSLTPDNKYPLMVFNHGGDTKDTWYDFVWKNLVPLGYIVVMPGDYEKYINDEHYAADQRYTLDWMFGNCNQNSSCPLYNMMTGLSIASGHSMGGGATFYSIGNYPLGQPFEYEFDAAFTLSGCAFSSRSMIEAIKNITNKDVFIMSATHDCICPCVSNANVFFTDITDEHTCKYLADITNGTHCHFMEPPLDIRDVPCLTEEEILCPIEYRHNIPKEKQWGIVNKYMALFLNATLYKNSQMFDVIKNELSNDKASGIMATVNNANCPS